MNLHLATKGISAFFLFISLAVPFNSSAAESKFSKCLLPRASGTHVSLGAPLAPERLGNKADVKFGILPFHFKDLNSTELSQDEKNDYMSAARLVEELSDNQVKIELKFFPTVTSSLELNQAQELLENRNTGWTTWDLTKSTFGIVKQTIEGADQLIDFSNVDSVILINKTGSLVPGVAEAFNFFRTPPDLNFIKRGLDAGYDFSFHRSVSTHEGIIDNAVLLDRRYSVVTIAHEMLHNFGLTDLYGPSTPPSIYSLSIMAADQRRLLNYEKAVLGWMPLDQIKCFELADLLKRPLKEASFQIEDNNKDQLIILRVSAQEAYFVEVVQDLDARLMIFYQLRMEDRPPITMLSVRTSSNTWTENASNLSINDIGKTFTGSDFRLHFSDKAGEIATFHIVSKDNYGTPDYSGLSAQIRENRDRAIAIEKAAVDKAAAELRAKQEAEAKAAADKAAAELKAKQEAEARAALEKARSKRKSTITCIQGKLTKKVTAVNPTCPKGYKRK